MKPATRWPHWVRIQHLLQEFYNSFFQNDDDYRVARFKHLGTKQGLNMDDIKKKLWKKKARA